MKRIKINYLFFAIFIASVSCNKNDETIKYAKPDSVLYKSDNQGTDTIIFNANINIKKSLAELKKIFDYDSILKLNPFFVENDKLFSGYFISKQISYLIVGFENKDTSVFKFFPNNNEIIFCYTYENSVLGIMKDTNLIYNRFEFTLLDKNFKWVQFEDYTLEPLYWTATPKVRL